MSTHDDKEAREAENDLRDFVQYFRLNAKTSDDLTNDQFTKFMGWRSCAIAARRTQQGGGVKQLLRDMRDQVEWSHVATMPIPLYIRMKEALTTLKPSDMAQVQDTYNKGSALNLSAVAVHEADRILGNIGCMKE